MWGGAKGGLKIFEVVRRAAEPLCREEQEAFRMPLHRCLSGSRPWCRTWASLVGLQVLAGQEEPPGPAGEAERLPVENLVCPRSSRRQNLRQHRNLLRAGKHARVGCTASWSRAF